MKFIKFRRGKKGRTQVIIQDRPSFISPIILSEKLFEELQ